MQLRQGTAKRRFGFTNRCVVASCSSLAVLRVVPPMVGPELEVVVVAGVVIIVVGAAAA